MGWMSTKRACSKSGATLLLGPSNVLWREHVRLYLDKGREAGRRPDGKFLTDLQFHDLRHEATSRLASIFPMHEPTKITGHKDPRMLMRYYHPRAEDLAKRLT
jgi:integrase